MLKVVNLRHFADIFVVNEFYTKIRLTSFVKITKKSIIFVKPTNININTMFLITEKMLILTERNIIYIYEFLY